MTNITIQIQIPEHYKEVLADISYATELSVDELVRRALVAYFSIPAEPTQAQAQEFKLPSGRDLKIGSAELCDIRRSLAFGRVYDVLTGVRGRHGLSLLDAKAVVDALRVNGPVA
jgi:hypothetical protein